MSDPAIWPMPAFHFAVAVDGVPFASVSEVTGLMINLDGDRSTPETVVLKRGIFAGDLAFWHWVEATERGHGVRTVTIDLLDEHRAAVYRWTLTGARPIRLTGPTLRTDSHEVAIEQIDIVCDRIAISIPVGE